ncbi:hypothetical protein [uncultured Dialister sp.]|jgi:hypothetical protein|uniref:hypothetical protein n=1 Tax=Dialister sp. TaxID=1955814 RepID=UPI0025D17E7F|nr:hypothetical protein [uncultured Dialister sp.]
MKLKRLAVCVLAASLLGTGAMMNVSAFSLGSVLGGVVKVGGIGFLVSKYGESINSAINSVMMKEGAGTNYATKVVPIVSIGNNGYIGAAQVIGDADQVEKVKAVGQLEISWNDKLFRIKGLIPMDSTNPSSFSRVQGVGVSAVIDVKV